MTNLNSDFSTKGKGYQVKVVQAMFEDHDWAESMTEIMDESFFTEAHLSIIVRLYYDYYEEFQVFPSIDTYIMLMKEKMQDGEKALTKQIVSFLRKVKTEPLGADVQIIKDNAYKFCKRNALGHAILGMAENLDEEDFDAEKIVEKMQAAIHLGESADLGHDYNTEMFKRHEQKKRRTISTGYELLDDQEVLNGGLGVGQIGVVMAPSGAGKSMLLVNLAANCLRQNLNVVYITLELSEADVGIRFDANFSRIGQSEVQNPANRADIEYALEDQCKGRLRIKYYPAYSLTIGQIRTYLRKLKNVHDFDIDVLVIDYADLMSSGQILSKDARGYENQGNNYVGLRSFGGEIGVPVWTAVQTNRGGVSKEVLDKDDISEDFKKVMHSDLIMGLSRSNDDKLHGLARLAIVKNRNGRDGHWYLAGLNTATTVFELRQEASEDLFVMKMARRGTKEHDEAKVRVLADFIRQREEDKEGENSPSSS